MFLFDTHTHLDAPQFDEDREEVIARAVEAGVSKMINIGFNRETIPTTMKLAESYDYIYAAVGWHPQDAINMKEGDLDWIASLCSHKKVVAIGEIGLDYYWDTSPKEVQHEVFRKQIGLARELKMPICIHDRDAHEDVVRRRDALLLRQLGNGQNVPGFGVPFVLRRACYIQECESAQRGVGTDSAGPFVDRNGCSISYPTPIPREAK
jgi:TatD family hydrolase